MEDAKKLTVPQLWLIGGNDQVAANDESYRLFNAMKKVKHKKLTQDPQADHFLTGGHSDLANKELFNFTQRLLSKVNIAK
jgi:pimeloyl-ACP methyl ester carboxylesterase